MRNPNWIWILALAVLACSHATAQVEIARVDPIPCATYPEVLKEDPGLPSPFRTPDGEEYLVAVIRNDTFGVVRVTLGDDRDFAPQLQVDDKDFPALAATGLHSEADLAKVKTITGRPLAEIDDLARPGGLSYDGFMAADETVLAVIRGDNRLVRRLGLTHPALARPLFHVFNLMEADLALDRWNMAKHRWEHMKAVRYNGKTVSVEAFDTKGGQKSVFDDGITGAFHLRLRRDPDGGEMKYLKKQYGHLPAERFAEMVRLLSVINTGEMEPQYIMRYGFYEGHTDWRTDPIAIAFIYGLLSLQEIDASLGGKLDQALTAHFTE